jgi:flagellar assembly protein FliH
MTQNNKYTFRNLDLLHGGLTDALMSPPRKRIYTESQITEIQDAAFAEGVVAGEKAALSGIEKQTLENLEIIGQQYLAMQSEVEHKMTLLRGECAELALLLARKLASALIASQPEAEFEKLLSACIPHLNAEPRIVVRVDKTQVEILKDRFENLSRKAGYPGRIVIIGEPDALPAQCQIEWADGGVSYRSPEQLDQIDRLISDYVTACRAQPGGSEVSSDASGASTYAVNQLVMENTQ